jgi:hypothetical protein
MSLNFFDNLIAKLQAVLTGDRLGSIGGKRVGVGLVSHSTDLTASKKI